MTHHFYLRLASEPWWEVYEASPLPPVPPFAHPVFTTVLYRKGSLAAARFPPPHPFPGTRMGERPRMSLLPSVCTAAVHAVSGTCPASRPLVPACACQPIQQLLCLQAKQQGNTAKLGTPGASHLCCLQAATSWG